jgi:polyhydroxyalkanoate synthesis regulator phasin
MRNEDPGCEPGEVCLGELSAEETKECEARLLVRRGKRCGKGGERYQVYVDKRELQSFLKQQELEFEEMESRIDYLSEVYGDLLKVCKVKVCEKHPEGEPPEQFEDEVFIGCYPSVENAYLAFDNLASIRGGSLAGEETIRLYAEDGRLSEEVVEMHYYFADKEESMAFLDALDESIRRQCSQYDEKESFYDRIKMIEGG